MANKVGIKQCTPETSPSFTITRKEKLTENRACTPVHGTPKHARIGSATNLHPSHGADLPNQKPEQAVLVVKAEAVRTYVEGKTILGTGAHASVLMGVDGVSGSPVAIKRRLRMKEAIHAQIESSMLRVIQGIPHCLALRAAWDVPANEEHVIVTDYVEVQDLYKSHLAPNAPSGLLSLDHIISIGKQSLEALARLRRIGVIHGDLKPENMAYCLLKRHLTILDWGCGIQVKQPVYLNGTMQTCFYRAPEVILGGPVDPSVDLWSLACVLYEQFTGTTFISGVENLDDLKDCDNYLIQQIAFQIGMPSLPFLMKCEGRSHYFNEEVEFRTHLNFEEMYWRVAIAQKGLERNLDADQVAEFTQLLEKMFQYDNRPPPEELLKLPIFKKDISIHITDLGSNQEAVIYRAEDVDAYLTLNTTVKPSPILELKQSVTKRHTCHHLPASGEYIFCNKATPLSQGMRRVRLLEDTTIDASFFEDTIFLWPEPVQKISEDNVSELFDGIAEFF